MSLYLRKALSFGPFRFNLSKSGVGLSVGVKGLRFGVSPRGNYVHMGRNGIYYRTAFYRGGQEGGADRDHSDQRPPDSNSAPNDQILKMVESGAASEMRDGSSREFLDEVNRKRTAIAWAPWIFALTVVVAVVGVSLSWGILAILAVAAFGVISTALIARRDTLAKTAIVMYELDDSAEHQFENLHNAFDQLIRCGRSWVIEASGQVQDRKKNAGASQTVRRTVIVPGKTSPKFIKTNVDPLCLPAGKQILYLLPDRILVVDQSGVGGLDYTTLKIERATSRLIESDALPSDASVVDSTWKYVNKKGGPDLRFKDNQELPIAEYENLTIQTSSGLNEWFQFSKREVAQQFEDALRKMGATDGPDEHSLPGSSSVCGGAA